MTCESRKTSRNKYAYRSVRDDQGRVVKEYLGRFDDPSVQVIRRQEALRKAQQKAANESDKTRAKEYERLVIELFELNHCVETVIHAWEMVSENTEVTFMETVKLEQPCDVTFDLEEFERVVRRANQGSDTALLELREILSNQPAIWKTLSDLGSHVRQQLLQLVAGDNAAILESLELNLGNLSIHLASESNNKLPPTIQRLLIDRVLVCWLEIHHCQAQYSQPRISRTVQGFWERQLDRAQSRYLRAITALDRPA